MNRLHTKWNLLHFLILLIILFRYLFIQKKKKIRGYNQSLCIAKGIKEILKIKIDSKSLQRKVNTESQTKKNKYSRWKNVGQVFELIDKNRLSNKHILIVDDVVNRIYFRVVY